MPAPYNDYARRDFVQHIMRLINDQHEPYGYKLVDLKEGESETVLEFHSPTPLRFPYAPDGKDIVYGTRQITVTVRSHYERMS